MKIFRIEHSQSKKGMWNTFCEKGKPLVSYLSNEVVANMPMPHSDDYGKHGRRWYSSAANLELLNFWFKPNEIQELIDMGFEVFELEVTEYAHKPNEVIFTKESIVSCTNVTHMFELLNCSNLV